MGTREKADDFSVEELQQQICELDRKIEIQEEVVKALESARSPSEYAIAIFETLKEVDPDTTARPSTPLPVISY